MNPSTISKAMGIGIIGSLLAGILNGIVTISGGCIPFTLLSRTPVLELLGFSTIPHIVWRVVLGVIGGYKLRFSSFFHQEVKQSTLLDSLRVFDDPVEGGYQVRLV